MGIQKRNAAQLLAVLAVGVLASHPAMAAIDVTAATTTITTDGTAAITAVGTALIGLAGVALVFRWVKAAFF
jgi:uncharacterized membrane protein